MILWQPDELIQQAIEKIKEFQTEGSLTYTYWIANKNVLEKQIEFFNTVDIGERNLKTGNLFINLKIFLMLWLQQRKY